jgi:hypothetical protein
MLSIQNKALRLCWVIALNCAIFVSSTFAAQCLGTTRKGQQCKNHASAGSSYCHFHDPSNKNRCAGTTKDGSPCRNNAKPGSSYCHVHASQ